MKNVYSTVIAIVALIMFVPVSALADTWGEPINDPTRFIVLASYNGEGVFDQETGLVWEQAPATATLNWFNAQKFGCNLKTVGNRKGWRLPTIQELASLVDPTVAPPGPTLPPGHPFSNVQSSLGYWSATVFATFTTDGYGVSFGNGGVFTDNKNVLEFVWCVRGGQGVDTQ